MTTESLNKAFAQLHAQREKDWPAEQLRRNVAQREALVRKYDAARHVQRGDIISPFELIEPDGTAITQDDVLDGPAVLIFFRFSGCPACNLALPYYNRQLWPALAERGVRLVAITPQRPELLDIGTRHDLSFTLASDPDNRLGRKLGITFEPEEKPEIPADGKWIGAHTGTGTWELPQPTVLVLDRDGRVAFVEVNPDWLNRTEADAIIAALDELREAVR